MAHRHGLVLAIGVFCTGRPLLSEAAQIAPNPNPVGSTIDIIDDAFAVNNLQPFENLGTIQILSVTQAAVLTNNGTLNNSGAVNMAGDIINFGTLTNNGTVTGAIGGLGHLSNVGTVSSSGTMELSGATNAPQGQWTNSGFMDAGANGMINQHGGTFTNSGIYQSGGTDDNSGLLTNPGLSIGTFFINNGSSTMINTADGNLRYDAGIFNAGTLHNSGQLSVFDIQGRNYTLDNFSTGKLQNDGTATIAGHVRNGGTLTNFGSIIGTDTYTQIAGETTNHGILSQARGREYRGWEPQWTRHHHHPNSHARQWRLTQPWHR